MAVPGSIDCGFMMTRASATCAEDGSASAMGWQEMVAVSVNGTGIASNGQPNQENVNFLGLKIVINERKPSISYVQRRLKIGYNRSARLLEAMEAAGVVGPLQPNGSREVLIAGGNGGGDD